MEQYRCLVTIQEPLHVEMSSMWSISNNIHNLVKGMKRAWRWGECRKIAPKMVEVKR